jgi:hypothetical protein
VRHRRSGLISYGVPVEVFADNLEGAMILSAKPQGRTRVARRQILSIAAAYFVSIAAAEAKDDFHGLLFQCDRHPTVQVSGHIAYAYEADMTTATQGTATLKSHAVTVSFPGKYASFTIVKRGDRFYADGKLCRANDV